MQFYEVATYAVSCGVICLAVFRALKRESFGAVWDFEHPFVEVDSRHIVVGEPCFDRTDDPPHQTWSASRRNHRAFLPHSSACTVTERLVKAIASCEMQMLCLLSIHKYQAVKDSTGPLT